MDEVERATGRASERETRDGTARRAHVRCIQAKSNERVGPSAAEALRVGDRSDQTELSRRRSRTRFLVADPLSRVKESPRTAH